MRTTQRIIKYFAIALAVLIIATIFSAVIGGVMLLGRMVWGEEFRWGGDTAWVVDEFAKEEIRNLDINVKTTTLKFVVDETMTDEAVRVETNNEYISTWIGGQTLNVIEKSHGIFGWGGEGEVIIRVRKGVKFEEVRVEVGAGVLNIESLETKVLDMNLGAGKTQISELKATESAEIEGGAGLIEVEGGELKNVVMRLGAGKAELRAKLVGENKIDAGVGKVELRLLGEEKEYKFSVKKGIGAVTLNGRALEDGEIRGEGATHIAIESGVGAVELRTGE